MGDITQLLQLARDGDGAARDDLYRRVYGELQKLARSRLAKESTLTQLDAGSLVHEAYLRLSRQPEVPGVDRRAFFAYASRVMRSVIVDYVRSRNADKRGGGAVAVTLSTLDGDATLAGPDFEALDGAMRRLAEIDERCHRIVELRYFGGLSIDEVCEVLELSPATVKRDWQKARAFLFQELQH